MLNVLNVRYAYEFDKFQNCRSKITLNQTLYLPINIPISVSETGEFLVSLRIFLKYSDVSDDWPGEWTWWQPSLLSSIYSNTYDRQNKHDCHKVRNELHVRC